ncbi:hypothetical protein IMSAG192_00208 [Muribaculaceae bacterium]|nr:hypothetical protein IMSAG192_00208 [Muribaculaceae bacterium]
MLGMDIYQKHGHVGEEVERHRRVVDESPRASGRGNLPAQDTDIIIPLDIICHTVLFQPLVVVKFESGLDYRFATRIAHSFQVGPLAKYERQSAEHNRLTGAGLSGDYVEPIVECDIDSVDKGVV